jgi:hypothetical protein
MEFFGYQCGAKAPRDLKNHWNALACMPPGRLKPTAIEMEPANIHCGFISPGRAIKLKPMAIDLILST